LAVCLVAYAGYAQETRLGTARLPPTRTADMRGNLIRTGTHLEGDTEAHNSLVNRIYDT